MTLKITFLLFLLTIQHVAQAAIAVPMKNGNFIVFQAGPGGDFIFFGCRPDELSDILVNPLLCGEKRLRYKRIDLDRRVYQELKPYLRNHNKIKSQLNIVNNAILDDKKMYILNIQYDFITAHSLASAANKIEHVLSCGNAGTIDQRIDDCPQLEIDNGWTLVTITKNSGKEVWRGRDGVIWGDIIKGPNEVPFGLEAAKAEAYCQTYIEENGNISTLKFRLPTIREAENAIKTGLSGISNCNIFSYSACSDYWYWSNTPHSNYGGIWMYTLQPKGSNFSKTLGSPSHTVGALRCVAQ